MGQTFCIKKRTKFFTSYLVESLTASLVSYTVINRRQHKVCDRLEQQDSEGLFCKVDRNGLHFQNLCFRKKTCQFTKLVTDQSILFEEVGFSINI